MVQRTASADNLRGWRTTMRETEGVLGPGAKPPITS
jgi:hypothetical protein